MQAWPTRDDYDRLAQRGNALFAEHGIKGRVVGSYADGTLAVPYSDLDFVLVGGPGEGPQLRDAALHLATRLDDPLCITIDPFATSAIVYAEYAIGLHVDWHVVELVDGIEQPVWRGTEPYPLDVAGRAWGTLLYVLSTAIRKDKEQARKIAAFELAQHWVWLACQGIDVSRLPPLVPSPNDDLIALVEATARIMPPHVGFNQLLQARLRMRPE